MQRIHKTVETKSRKFCSVPQCSSYCTKDISLHGFPLNDKSLCKEWQIKLKIGKTITKCMKVCSKHFVRSDFILGEVSTISTKKRRLKKNVVPSENLPVSSVKTSLKSQTRNSKWLHRNESASQEQVTTTNDLVELPGVSLTKIVVSETPQKTLTQKPSLQTVNPQALEELKAFSFTEDKSTQTDFAAFEFSNVLNNDEKLSHFTGVNENILNTYIKCCKNVTVSTSTDVSDTILRRNIIIVLCKLKLNISFVCLSTLFGVSPFKCSDIFYATVSLLSSSIKTAIYWPTKEAILQNMPKCFEKFRDTRIVLDCTEVKLQKFKCLKSRVMSYSHYKGAHTAKFLIGITPSGLISFVSKAYGGRVTDKAIFNKENLIEKLDPYDAVMVDKGVLIKQECDEFSIKVHQPPFLKKKKQLSPKEAVLTVEIARARVHVERAIQRIKIFKIFQDQIPLHIIPYIDDIMTIIAATVNMSPPILADDKF